MKTIAISLKSVAKCGMCKVLMVHKVDSPMAILAFNEMREANGYTGRRVSGKGWLDLVREHEAMHAGKGEFLPAAMTARSVKGQDPKAIVTDEERAIREFERVKDFEEGR